MMSPYQFNEVVKIKPIAQETLNIAVIFVFKSFWEPENEITITKM